MTLSLHPILERSYYPIISYTIMDGCLDGYLTILSDGVSMDGWKEGWSDVYYISYYYYA